MILFLSQEVFEEVNGLQVYGGKCEDFADVWDLIENKHHFFSDFDEVDSKEDFERFYKQSIYDVCVARKDGEIVYASWIVASGWKSFYYCAVAKKGFNSISLSKKLFDITVNYYKKYEINRFDALVNMENRTSRICLYRLGFKCLGRIPKLLQINGNDTDYCQYYMEV